MSIPKMGLVMGGATLLGAGLGAAIGTGGSKLYSKVTGKPAGVPGSLAHVMTNDKLDNKGAVVKDQLKETGKDLLTIGGITAGTAGAAALGAAKSKSFAGLLTNAKSAVAGVLDKVSIAGKEGTVKDLVKNTKIYKAFNGLPKTAKAAIAAGGAALAIFAPLLSQVTAQKAGYIEGQNEVK